jgi:hypothetical protein
VNRYTVYRCVDVNRYTACRYVVVNRYTACRYVVNRYTACMYVVVNRYTACRYVVVNRYTIETLRVHPTDCRPDLLKIFFFLCVLMAAWIRFCFQVGNMKFDTQYEELIIVLAIISITYILMLLYVM